MKNSVQQQRGITLIEILVTVIILSIGFLGLASVQLAGTKNVTNSQNRTLATLYAYDMVERMRANIAGIDNSSYHDSSTKTATDPNCTTCSFSDQAAKDVFEWKQLIEASPINGGLPGGLGTIEFDANGAGVDDDVYIILVTWSESVRDGREQDSQAAQLRLEVKL